MRSSPGTRGSVMDVRSARKTEVDHLAKVWHDAWHDAHARIVPPELTRVRTFANFRRRLAAALSAVRVIGPLGMPVGFHIVQGDELYQLFVSAEARGTGVARALLVDAETRLAEKDVRTAWLACAIGNERAARFYEKCGWRRVGTVINHLRTEEGPFDLEVWRYEKVLLPHR
jgi:ribosomal protein S18 acetylase RimI-like enzyme